MPVCTPYMPPGKAPSMHWNPGDNVLIHTGYAGSRIP